MAKEAKKANYVTIDGNSAAAHVAYAFSEVAAIYPITPSSPMGEEVDEWASQGKKNMFGEKIDVVEMQSEGGAAGALHGSLSAGALTTTFTASQGLMLMLPNMYKIAGELLPTVFHVSARSLACQSLSIYGDHSDVMAVRDTGFAMMASNSVQEVMDLSVVCHLATLESRVPFLSFFDGFRTSHEVQKIEEIDYETLKSMVEMKYIEVFRKNALNPEHPKLKVGAQNPDVYFQGRETVNKYYDNLPKIVKKYMKLVADKTGRKYKLFDYIGAKDAKMIIVAMGSSCETIEETINYLTKKGKKVGAVKVRLYRPFFVEDFLNVIPKSVKRIAVLDRTKEPGSIGEPLYLDVVAALKERRDIMIVGGRYGLSSKEFTPPMVKAVYDHLEGKNGKVWHGFTVGIKDDVTKKSLDIEEDIETEAKGVVRCKFWGYGSDGTVGANKNSIKIIGDNTDLYVQGYFFYDSKKSGGVTVSHLRFGKEKIQSQYLLTESDFIALHKQSYIGMYDILEGIKEGGIFLLNSNWKKEEVFCNLTKEMQNTIVKKKIKVYNIDALKIAKEAGLGGRVNTVMQAVFFKLSGVLPEQDAIKLIKDAAQKAFAKKGEQVVKMNWNAIDSSIDALEQVDIPKDIKGLLCGREIKKVPEDAGEFATKVIGPVMKMKGDDVPVSKMPIDGSVPLSTNKFEKRCVGDEVPHWIKENCIQCAQCSFVCPHATIRVKQIKKEDLAKAPQGFDTIKSISPGTDLQFKVQVYPEDCVGCGSCALVCPGKMGKKALEMKPIESQINEKYNVDFFEKLPEILDGAPINTIKGSQLKTPLFEFSGACAGCGETPYVKLVTQLFGDNMIIANATGCSSIYGGTFPTVPYCVNKEGKGPAWGNSLFEDNGEYGFGFRLAVDANRKQLLTNMKRLIELGIRTDFAELLKKQIAMWDSRADDAKKNAKEIVRILPEVYNPDDRPEARKVMETIRMLLDFIVDKSVWIFGGDGWAYDIGYGGLDHVMAQGKDVNVLILDTEVYSNTGGQSSKSTPLGAVAKFAAAGKRTGKKNLGLMMMTYGNVFVASVNMGANKMAVIKAMIEAEKYKGPSIIIAYCPCISHGIDMGNSIEEEKKAADAGYWPCYTFNPDYALQGKDPFVWQSGEEKMKYRDFLEGEVRYNTLHRTNPDVVEELFSKSEKDAKRRNEDVKRMINKSDKSTGDKK